MPLTPADRAALVARYRDGYAAVAAAVAAVSPDRLDGAHDGTHDSTDDGTHDSTDDGTGDGWTARQVVHHLADSEMTAAVRLRRLLAEDAPVIAGYDEAAFAERLHYRERPLDAALRAVEAARATSADLLDRLTEADWARRGTHTESGPYGVEDWLVIYAAHAEDHAAQIRRAGGR